MLSISPLYVICYANISLIVASILYILHLWLQIHAIGAGATCFSVMGTAGLIFGIGCQSLITWSSNHHYTATMGGTAGGTISGTISNTISGTPIGDTTLALPGLTYIVALFCAASMVVYLIMEWWYKTRSTGAFVIPLVAITLLQQLAGTLHLLPLWSAILKTGITAAIHH